MITLYADVALILRSLYANLQLLMHPSYNVSSSFFTTFLVSSTGFADFWI
ncbi:hypothetical protein SAMN04488122_2324 [Chitinophaga arvensicola]|uniref:Uncharacterized protein n=1 Tax=Chitinophaga arvensicola TaxID=29529 RepID=A0A1I0R670_9BACT|nr:hypothetical protein SAMN04488122_2324 [Chitinophaga arvensicola]